MNSAGEGSALSPKLLSRKDMTSTEYYSASGMPNCKEIIQARQAVVSGIRHLQPCSFAAGYYFAARVVLEFTKMSGAGNDFILLDNRDRKIALTPATVARLCDRHQGVGADGVILLVPPKSAQANWAWEFYNSDGSTGEMCGNGARCFARFVKARTGTNNDFTFETEAGLIQASFLGERITVNLTAPADLRLNQQVSLRGGAQLIHSVNTGVPHAVLFVPDADKAMVRELGPEIQRHPHFGPKGTNVNFVQVLGPNRIRVRTFERGVEGETLACGTGVTASALVAACVQHFTSPVDVQVQSGQELEVSFEQTNGSFSNVRLSGPADFVFEGKVTV
jgi:diaminopimelate epimerase